MHLFRPLFVYRCSITTYKIQVLTKSEKKQHVCLACRFIHSRAQICKGTTITHLPIPYLNLSWAGVWFTPVYSVQYNNLHIFFSWFSVSGWNYSVSQVIPSPWKLFPINPLRKDSPWLCTDSSVGSLRWVVVSTQCHHEPSAKLLLTSRAGLPHWDLCLLPSLSFTLQLTSQTRTQHSYLKELKEI